MEEEKPKDIGLTSMFKSVSETEVQNKEIAALMGEVNEESPNTLPGGLISKLGITDAKLVQAKSKKRYKDFRNWLWREAIKRSLKRINDIIEDLQFRIEELLKSMVKSEEELAMLDNQHEILEAELGYFHEQGLFDCDEDGKLKNSEAEAVVAAWEKENGQAIDRTDLTSYGVILQILVDIEKRQSALRKRIKKDTTEYDFRQKQLDEALQIREGLQGGERILEQKTLYELESFLSGYDVNYEFEGQIEIEEAYGGDVLLMEGVGELPEDLDADLSFGFPPIKESFVKAVTDNNMVSLEKNRASPSSGNRTVQLVEPTN